MTVNSITESSQNAIQADGERTEQRDYQFRGVPLTSAIAQFLILELFEGRLIERTVIDAEVLRVHLGAGGEKPIQPVQSVIKRALTNLKEQDSAANTAKGFWRIAQNDSKDLALQVMNLSCENQSEAEAAENTIPIADLDIGDGPGAIYVYYLPIYRQFAERNGEPYWPCKIGRTDRDPLARVLAQAATALPEKPHIALIVRTSKPLAWETALHGVLTLRGLKIEDSPGAEWFLTSPQNVLDLVKLFDPQFSNAVFPDSSFTLTANGERR